MMMTGVEAGDVGGHGLLRPRTSRNIGRLSSVYRRSAEHGKTLPSRNCRTTGLLATVATTGGQELEALDILIVGCKHQKEVHP